MLEKIKKYKNQIAISTGVLLILFISSYTISRYNFKDKDVNTLTKETASQNIKSEGAEIKFLIKYSNCNDFIEDEKMNKIVEKDKDKLKGLTQKELEEIYKEYNYKLSKCIDNKIEFVKDIEGYQYGNGKFFIGISGEKVVIYNRNQEGNLIIAESVVPNGRSEDQRPIKLNNIKDKGNLTETLYEGKKEYQFDTKEEALEYAKALCNS
ncbi:hypothetical protein [Clostridium ihumii]|uniref:hypothetical protein n=1 Tax=Clostridium ihumii TaxID=1470356 RepID=UPI00058F8A94|nr:hypothetical protein [Clostridium ihumii]